MKIKNICAVITGTPVNVFSQSAHDYLAWECSPEVVGEKLADERVIEVYSVYPERSDKWPPITIVVA